MRKMVGARYLRKDKEPANAIFKQMSHPTLHLNDVFPTYQQDWAKRFKAFELTGRVCPYPLFENPEVFQSGITALLEYLEAQGMDSVLIEADYQDDRNACPEVIIQFVFSAKKADTFLLWNLPKREQEASFSELVQTLATKRIIVGFVFNQSPEKLPLTFYCSHEAW
jgi:hypothetical protein